MIIYGTGGSDLGAKELDHETCPSCNEKGQLHLYGASRYFSLFWIPVFPFSKKIITVCGACQTEISKKEYSRELQNRIDSEKSNFKIPITNFIGLILIALIACWAIYQSKQHDTFVENRVANLQVGDVLTLKENSKEYYFMQVEEHTGDSLFMKHSNYYLDQKPYRSDYNDGLLKQDFMDTLLYLYLQEELDSIYNTGDIDILD